MTPPPGSRIEVVERGTRLVLRVPPGTPHGRSLLGFALFWNAFSWPIAGLFWSDAIQQGIDWDPAPGGQGGGPVPWFGLPFISLFPLVGIGVALIWAKLRFTRTLLLAELTAEGGRVAVRTEWFGFEKTRTATLEPGERATREVAFEENGVDRYQVRVGPKGERGRTVAFGAAWDEATVRWVAAEINGALGVTRPGNTDLDGPPRTVPAAARERVDHPHVRESPDARGRPVVEVRLWPGWPAAKRVWVGFGVLFGAVWWTIVGHMVADELADARANGNWADPFGLLFCVPFAVAGLVWTAGTVALCRGTARTIVGDEFLSVRWGMGGLGYARNVRRDRVGDVVIWENFRTGMHDGRSDRTPVAAVRLGPPRRRATHLPLTLGGGRDLAEAVAAVVKHHLEATGWQAAPAADDTPGDGDA